MIRHILIVAWRNICKYKVSAGIAVVGLKGGKTKCDKLSYST